MATYVLYGDAYLSDGEYNTVEITKGTLKHCQDMVKKIIKGEYINIEIYKEDNEHLIHVD